MISATKENINEVGLTEVYSSPNPQVDVVFVHGLNGHPYNTWATHKPEVFWPSELLPSVAEEQNCRVLTYGYDANVTAFTDGASRDHVHNHAEHLAARLVANRSVKARERPIIFVAHSLGGLVVKRMLIQCESINNPKLERLRSIYVSTFGILFLGTPHNGSDLAKWGSILQSICSATLPRKFFDSSPQLVNALRSNNETLQNINRLFIEISEPFRIYFFHEQKPMDLKGTRQFVVDEDSAAPIMQGVERMGIEKDHSTMCKFEDINAPGFDVVSDAIATYAEEAPRKIMARWQREKLGREYYRRSMASDILSDSIMASTSYQYEQPLNSPLAHLPSQSPQSSTGRVSSRRPVEGVSAADSYVIEEPEGLPASSKLIEEPSTQSTHKQPRVAPLLFRPNSIFVGFEIELEQLKHKLKSEKKSSMGTCPVLICGPPGSGKSHLARQYVWTQQADYHAGIFWVDCKSQQSMDRYYWDIGQALGCFEGDHTNTSRTDRSFIQEVRQSLESLRGWLIVFDGIFFDSDEALSDFVPYLPDSPGNSIIYTSIDPTLKNRHRLLSPSWIRMRPLSLRAAQDLLFKSLGMRDYNSVRLKKAQDLVRFYRCLPLGIHAAAHMLVAQGRALEKFSPVTSDRRLSNPFLEIVRALEKRGYREAMTLLVLLSFLSHKIPVVLLQLGSSSLFEYDREIESFDRTDGLRRDLDNTIGVLLRYGLVERELQTCSVSSPGRGRLSPQLSRTTTQASVAYSTPTVPTLPEDDSDLKLVTTTDAPDSGHSAKSVSITIDTLRTHTIAQAIVREEVQARGLQGISYDQWLVLTAHFLVASYNTAAIRLGALPGHRSVADYREYKSHVTSLWKFMPRSHKGVSVSLANARENLRVIYRDIQTEIRKRSPSQSQSSHDGPYKYVASIFETSATSSDDGATTPTSGLTRASTWSSERLRDKSESPTQYHLSQRSRSDEAISDGEDEGYRTELDDLPSTLQSSQRWDTSSDTTTKPEDDGANSRQALLQAILQGHADNEHRKDLGEFKPVPTVGGISSPTVETMRPRSTSTSSFNLPWPFRSNSPSSSAEASLAAIQARHSKAAAGSSASRQNSSSSRSRERTHAELIQQPLDERPPNIQTPTVFSNNTFLPPDVASKSEQDSNSQVKRSSISPRLVNAVLTRQAEMAWDELPVEENISITRRFPARSSLSRSVGPGGSSDSFEIKPSGYSSVPMSRDTSHNSAHSILSAPSDPLPIPNSFNPAYLDVYQYQVPALPSMDVALARSLDLNQSGGWTTGSPFGLDTDNLDLEMERPQIRTAPTSAPMSPVPSTTPKLNGSDHGIDSPARDLEGKSQA